MVVRAWLPGAGRGVWATWRVGGPAGGSPDLTGRGPSHEGAVLTGPLARRYNENTFENGGAPVSTGVDEIERRVGPHTPVIVWKT